MPEVPFENESTLLLPDNKPKRCYIPQRYILSLMGSLAVVNAFMMRVVLSVAITTMTLPSNQTEIFPKDSCPSPKLNQNSTLTVTSTSPLYDWDEELQGIILSSFNVGYIITHLPGGILAEKYGGKHVLGFSILFISLLTLMTPITVRVANWPGLLIVRILVGLGEGTIFPVANALLAKWAPLSERTKLGTVVYSGAAIGVVIGNAVSGILIERTNSWEAPFYAFGGAGIVWFVLWCYLCYSEPNQHPFITKEEIDYLQSEIPCSVPNDEKDIPWRCILTSVPLFALAIANFGYAWGYAVMVIELPEYMKSVLKFNIEQSGIWSALPYISMFLCAMVSAWLCDWLIKERNMKITFARKCFANIASMVAGIFLISASYSGCNRIIAVALFSIGMGLMGACYSGLQVNGLDLAPNYAGTIMGIVSLIGSIGGVFAPIVCGIIVQGQTLSEWRVVFWITFIIFIVTDLFFLLFASGNEQWWNRLKIEKM